MHRVIQWGTGGMGRNCLRAIIDHPALALAGVYVYSAAKAGRDAGELARRPATGVIATRDLAQILALDADVVIHAARLVPPYGTHDDDIVPLLESGKNVISINGYSSPAHWRGARLERLEAACRTGGSTLLGAGLNPGFVGEQLAVVATSICTAIDGLEIVESVDCTSVRSPEYVFDALGFGADPLLVDPNDAAWGPAASLNGMYEEVLAAIAERLGLRLERVETEHRAFAATRDLRIAAGEIPRGRVSHFLWRWHGIEAGERRLTMSIHWYMERTHLDDPDPPLWRLHIRGQPGVRLAVQLEKRAGDDSPTSAEQIALAGSVVNSIPLVVAAPPGVMLRPLATPYRAEFARGGSAPARRPVDKQGSMGET